jgi:hypothetical protein
MLRAAFIMAALDASTSWRDSRRGAPAGDSAEDPIFGVGAHRAYCSRGPLALGNVGRVPDRREVDTRLAHSSSAVGVMGAASGELDPDVVAGVRRLGAAIARAGCTRVRGVDVGRLRVTRVVFRTLAIPAVGRPE